MYKYVVLLIMLVAFYFFRRRNPAYVLPLILVVYSNVNGLLDWEDFALQGLVKFQDYGLILSLLVLFKVVIMDRYSSPWPLVQGSASCWLYNMLALYWGYYLLEFLCSIILHGSVEWPIKMGRVFFYGVVVYVAYLKLKPSPVLLFERVIDTLMICTVVFGVLYVAYNVFGFDLYPKEAHEEFVIKGVAEVKRNFAGFPTYGMYFLILFLHRLLHDKTGRLLNFSGTLLMAGCVLLTLTRGAVMSMVVVVAVTILYRRPSVRLAGKIILFVVAVLLVGPFLMQYAQGHLEVLAQRFGEFADSGGATRSGNFMVRSQEFWRIINNVLDFNPILGFGFTNLAALHLRYQSNLLHGGSADNGISNLIGVTGFLGLALYSAIIALWVTINLKLQRLNREPFAKVNFIFILYMLISLLDGASMSYMHNYCLFLVYDFLAYAYLTRAEARVACVPREVLL